MVKVFFAFLSLLFFSKNVMAQGTYTWLGGTSDFTLSANWSPNRGTLDNGDVLIFQSTGVQSITNVPDQIVATITVQSSATITLTPAGTNTLAVTSSLTISSGCSLTISNNLTLANTGAIAVNGLLDFKGINAVSPGGITVNNGGELKLKRLRTSGT